MILECRTCEALVNAEFAGSYDYGDESTLAGKFSLLKCPNCGKPFLVDEDALFGPIQIYPSPDNRINPGLPAPLKSSYGEAIACYKGKAYTATAIMCRKTLEGICVEHGVKSQNLLTSLKELKEKGIIENRLYEWSDALRISGNEAAHDVRVTISAEDAKDILEFTNALLEYVFTFRDKFEQFKNRRAKKAST